MAKSPESSIEWFDISPSEFPRLTKIGRSRLRQFGIISANADDVICDTITKVSRSFLKGSFNNLDHCFFTCLSSCAKDYLKARSRRSEHCKSFTALGIQDKAEQIISMIENNEGLTDERMLFLLSCATTIEHLIVVDRLGKGFSCQEIFNTMPHYFSSASQVRNYKTYIINKAKSALT